MKKMLMVATVPSMIGQFNMSNIELLQEMGYEVHVACNFNDRSVWTDEKVADFECLLDKKNIRRYQIDFSRNASKINRHIASYKKLKEIVKNGEFSFVHCHTPIAGIISRLVCKKTKTKCIYTAHGLHFYKGGNKKNWLLYYPLEKICSSYTDVLITINKEDYDLVSKRFKAKRYEHIPGVGIDLEKYQNIETDFSNYMEQWGIYENDIIILSVGEVNSNKNHQLIIRSMAEIEEKNIHYIVAGIGEKIRENEELANMLGVGERVHFIGYRNDIPILDSIADIFAFPSIREGLGLAAIEALACGTPVIGMNTRGIREYVLDEETGFRFDNNVKSCKNAILNCIRFICEDKNYEIHCKEMAAKYSKQNTEKIMYHVYENIEK